MLPVLFRLSFTTLWMQLLLYAAAVGVVASVAVNGWRGTLGPVDAKTGKEGPASLQDKLLRAVGFAVVGGFLAYFGLMYALPADAFPGGRGEGIPLHTYGVLLAAGFVTAVSVAGRLAQDEWRRVSFVDGRGWVDTEGPQKREQVLDMAFWVLVGGLVGSRVLFVLVNWQDYARDWTQVFSLGGGLVFYGGLIGAGLAAFLFARRHGLDFLRLADVCIPTVSLGQCLGRLGCFSAGCCWGDMAGSHSHTGVTFPGSGLAQDLFGQLGRASSLAYGSQAGDDRFVVEATGQVLHEWAPGAVRISDWVAQHGTTLPVYPTQLFESVGQLVLFVALLYARRIRRFHGHIFALWLMAYAVLRTTVELFRGDVERGTLHGLLESLGAQGLAGAVPLEAWYNVSTSQFISLCMFTFGALLMARHRPAGEAAGLGPTPSAA
ncbi:prolipoprotein diacylglyceryl transferase [Corallococcus sp. AB032C]|uniref:prolipoprotein diacylglyceryl transferase n=1 Tax=Corallococcus TaxID=83461 RepID=UPI000EC5D2FB|nr:MULTISPECIES: prolipoprotein diacylglyceryl transferase [Corallococcus]NPC50949.1 prolipoprotein diacylglyceryl transferase [Corallococcus exiguus]RKH75962.1 prolipoprotein diacylglyceryl transferase [Corallococcus sp. AB032C]